MSDLTMVCGHCGAAYEPDDFERHFSDTRSGEFIPPCVQNLYNQIEQLRKVAEMADHIIEDYLDVENLTTQTSYHNWKAAIRELEDGDG